jgi:hypothetical protein
MSQLPQMQRPSPSLPVQHTGNPVNLLKQWCCALKHSTTKPGPQATTHPLTCSLASSWSPPACCPPCLYRTE